MDHERNFRPAAVRCWSDPARGTTGRPCRAALNTLQAYDPITNRWRVLAPVSTARAMPGAACVDGQISAMGGSTTAGHALALATLDIDNPESNRPTQHAATPPAGLATTISKAPIPPTKILSLNRTAPATGPATGG
ncbi:MAG: hypothetical protein ABSH51_13800 [Solirubrobacteraceae bacterium]|jgi:hypothetical protein